MIKPAYVYPKGTMLVLLQSDKVSAVTKEVLAGRIENLAGSLCFFEQHEFDILTVISDVLLAQDSLQRVYNPATEIDKRLAAGRGNGWRYDKMPADAASYKMGLEYIENSSLEIYKKPFVLLDLAEQVSLLKSIQYQSITEPATHFLPHLFFEEMLSEVVELYYSNPLVQESIGFAGMADLPGWLDIGLNGHDAGDIDEIYNRSL